MQTIQPDSQHDQSNATVVATGPKLRRAVSTPLPGVKRSRSSDGTMAVGLRHALGDHQYAFQELVRFMAGPEGHAQFGQLVQPLRNLGVVQLLHDRKFGART